MRKPVIIKPLILPPAREPILVILESPAVPELQMYWKMY